MKSIIIKSLLAAALLVPFTAGAVPIQGDIGITGSLLPTCGGSSAGCDMLFADGVDFAGDSGFVVFATGDFAGAGGLISGSSVAMNDFDFAPFSGLNNPLWDAGGFSFALNTVVVGTQTSVLLELSGTGLISFAGPGLDPTMGNWSFSADTTSGASSFAWSSTAAPTPTPEPGILVLMGLGLIGGLGARRLSR